MNYLEHIGKYFLMLKQVFRKPQKWSVFKEMLFREIEDLGLKMIIHKSLLGAILEYIGRNSLLKGLKDDLERHYQSYQSDKIFEIENSIITLLEKITPYYDNIIIAIDNLGFSNIIGFSPYRIFLIMKI